MKLHWGNAIFIFFVIFLSLCAVFIVFSLRQNNDLVTKDYYQKGANYSQQIQINKRSAIYQDSIEIKNLDGFLRFDLAPAIVESADSLFIYFFRPSDKSEDLRLNFVINNLPIEVNQGALIHGRYKVQVSWKMNDELYEITKPVDVR